MPKVLFRGAQPLTGLDVERGRTDEADLNAYVEPGGKIQFICDTRTFR